MYTADSKRYETMQYNRCGASGLKLPIVSLGLWHNFGDTGCYDNMKAMCRTAFDHGILSAGFFRVHPIIGVRNKNLCQRKSRFQKSFRQNPFFDVLSREFKTVDYF